MFEGLTGNQLLANAQKTCGTIETNATEGAQTAGTMAEQLVWILALKKEISDELENIRSGYNDLVDFSRSQKITDKAEEVRSHVLQALDVTPEIERRCSYYRDSISDMDDALYQHTNLNPQQMLRPVSDLGECSAPIDACKIANEQLAQQTNDAANAIGALLRTRRG